MSLREDAVAARRPDPLSIAATATSSTVPSDSALLRNGNKRRRHKNNQKTTKAQVLVRTVVVMIGLCGIVGIGTSILHVNRVAIPYTSSTNTIKSELLRDFFEGISKDDYHYDRIAARPVDETTKNAAAQQKQTAKLALDKRPAAAGDPNAHYPKLSCQAFGGPSEEAAQEMVYWQGQCVTAHSK